MTSFQRVIIVAAALVLSACSSSPQRNFEACIMTGVVAGGLMASGGGGALIAGAVAGGGTGAVLCNLEVAEPEPRAVAVLDSDGDGVADDADRCPGTPTGVGVDADGCALDSDGDGVPDYTDRCANTPSGADVDDWGCAVAGAVMFSADSLKFAFDSARLTADGRRVLDAAVAVIRDHPGVKLDLVGHTDSVGSTAYNQSLSERRARAAVEYLVSQGVPADQLRALGRGEAEPVASNDSDSGRARNRRVELIVR